MKMRGATARLGEPPSSSNAPGDALGREPWEGAAFNASAAADEDDAMLRELKARKEAAMARAKAAAEGLPLPGADPLKEAKAEAKRAKKDAKRMKGGKAGEKGAQEA